MNQPFSYNKLYNIGLNLDEALTKAGLTSTSPDVERGFWTSVWVNGSLIRCYVKAPK